MKRGHPCFDKDSHRQFGRIHLPVAPLCNIRCGFCDRRYSCVNESRPGVTAKVISPAEACQLALRAGETFPELSVAGIAGPGDPLANPRETLETLRLIGELAPRLMLCLSTNGFALPEYARELSSLGVRHLTVTVNAVDPAIGALVYDAIGPLKGLAGAELLLERQLEGIAAAKKFGMTIKINTVIIPGVNDGHAAEIARQLSELGGDLMNCIPLAPIAGTRFGRAMEPGPKMMAGIREKAEKWLPQMRHCSRCRADSLGLLGEKGTIADLTPRKTVFRASVN